MAFGGGTDLLGNTLFNSKTSSTTVVSAAVSPGASIGDLVVVLTAWDNTDTTDVNPTRLSVTDSVGNTYSRIREFVNGQGAAAAGAHVGMFYSILTVALVAGSSTITVTSNTARIAKSGAAAKFTIGAGSTISVDAIATDLADDGAVPGSMALSGLASAQRLYLRASAEEAAPGAPWSAGTNFTRIASDGTIGGGAASNMHSDAEWRINTSTGETSAPSGTASADCASIFVALLEVPVIAGYAWPALTVRNNRRILL